MANTSSKTDGEEGVRVNNKPDDTEAQLKSREAALDKKAEELLAEEKKLDAEKEKFDIEKEKLKDREKAVQDAEVKRDRGYTDERKKLNDELFDRNKKFEEELSKRLSAAREDDERLLSEERKERMESLEKEIAAKREEAEKSFKEEKADIEKKKNELQRLLKEQEERADKLAFQETRLQVKETNVEQKLQSIKDEIKKGIAEDKKDFDTDKSRLEGECAKLRDEIQSTKKLIDLYEDLKRKLDGEDPERVLIRLKSYEEHIAQLKKELTERPPKEMLDAIDSVKKEKETLENACTRISEDNQALKSKLHVATMERFEKNELEDKIKSLTSRLESMTGEVNRLEEENKRMRASYERVKDRDDRIKDIEKPFFEMIGNTAAFKETENKKYYLIDSEEKEISEIKWLDGISKKCAAYGLKFPKRILYAYHTSLKTAEWSPLTVLAGVSGTGKSELPRLYAHFGGLNFLGISVQPNWDSQESMLGFFNPIDNRFDAQPVLRLLAQSQRDPLPEYPGLNDVMTLILLDEMNLAHVELYFAEFLSKLEARRGKPQEDIETIEVKLGSGIAPYPLGLGRNVLWTGTMNQDETTKSLSDKVLDRGIIISFPRPSVLERRKKLNTLGKGDFAAAQLLPRKVWQSWRKLDSLFTDDQIKPYKAFIEEMNKSLAKVSRALGHRVWQSIEYYMANYPTVIDALAKKDEAELKKQMHLAFEDQLVQKVMPKLRGIETRGSSRTDCLDKIRAQLDREHDSILEDFDLACEFGYGQFIWNSANYIKDDEDPPAAQPADETKAGKNRN